MNVCDKCNKVVAILLLLLGFAFLLVDLNVWNFWGVSWYTALLLLAGIAGTASGTCPDCQKIAKRK